MRMTSISSAIFTFCAATAAFGAGAVFNLKPGLTDIPTKWQAVSSYVEGDIPEAGDIVVVPNSTIAYVDDDTVTFVSSLKRVQTTGYNSGFVVFDISTNATINCAVNAQSTTLWLGKLVKRGDGDLTLNSNGDYSSGRNDYYASITVEKGGLRIGPDTYPTSLNIQAVKVEEGGTFYLGTQQFNLVGLSGSGLVTNESAGRVELYVGTEALKANATPYTFSGAMGGNIGLHSRFHMHLTGENSTFSMFSQEAQSGQNRKTGGVTGVKKFGMAGGASSIGSASTLGIMGYAGRLLREDAVLAADPGAPGAFLWQDAPTTADAPALVHLFETFLDSCDWWRARVAGDAERPESVPAMMIRP